GQGHDEAGCLAAHPARPLLALPGHYLDRHILGRLSARSALEMDASGLPVERSIRPYLIGLGLAFILTAIPFALVALSALPRFTMLIVIAVAAVLQILVHFRFFLHIGIRSTPAENLIALAFAAILIVFMVGGTLWIMFDLHYRMMV